MSDEAEILPTYSHSVEYTIAGSFSGSLQYRLFYNDEQSASAAYDKLHSVVKRVGGGNGTGDNVEIEDVIGKVSFYPRDLVSVRLVVTEKHLALSKRVAAPRDEATEKNQDS